MTHFGNQALVGKHRARKQRLRDLFDRLAPERDCWIERNTFYYEQDLAYMKFLVPPGVHILDVGCGTGRLLEGLRPSKGLGVDLSRPMIDVARKNRISALEFEQGDIEDPGVIRRLNDYGPFDVIVLSDTLGYLDDCLGTLQRLRSLCNEETRIVVAYYSHLWEPLLNLATWLGRRMPSGEVNWLGADDLANLLDLAGYEVVKREWRQLIPFKLLGLGNLANRFLATLPLVRKLCIRHYLVARLSPAQARRPLSCSVVIPCRNERGNIEAAVTRLPPFCDDLELVFVEGGSNDGTWKEIQRVRRTHPDRKILALRQTGTGKYDAVRAGFEHANGDILIIMDADLTVPPEEIAQFYDLLVSGKGEFVNGTRLVYGMELSAMQFLNYWANRMFAAVFSYLLNQRFSDTLCGAKALRKSAYDAISRNRDFWGDFDPFGDFDLIFGAAKLNLRIVEVPVHYAARRYGETEISRFSDGWLLLRMILFAYRKLKAF